MMPSEVLIFESCPNARAAVELVDDLLTKLLRIDADVREIRVERSEETEGSSPHVAGVGVRQ